MHVKTHVKHNLIEDNEQREEGLIGKAESKRSLPFVKYTLLDFFYNIAFNIQKL